MKVTVPVRTGDGKGHVKMEEIEVKNGEDLFDYKTLARNRMDRIQKALAVAARYGGTDGDHHKAWVIDQMVRALHPDENVYLGWVREFEDGDDGPKTYEWNEGVAP